jgi:hypothetical protein
MLEFPLYLFLLSCGKLLAAGAYISVLAREGFYLCRTLSNNFGSTIRKLLPSPFCVF